MWNKFRNIIKSAIGQNSHGVSAKAPSFKTKHLPELSISLSGRIQSTSLLSIARSCDAATFITIVTFPVLVGSSIKEGTLSPRKTDEDPRSRPGKLLPTTILTQLFRADQVSELAEGTTLEHAIYPIKRGPTSSHTELGQFFIGRASGNDLVMVDFAISDQHACISSSRVGFSIADLQSTNGTHLNGKRINNKPQLLKDGDIVRLGRFEFTFLTPATLHEIFNEGTPTA